ncbi:hypothetical protein U8V72_20260 [Priestia filamentosa]|uniref:hypothetical protein n=1 Tax=Priestia filamentosa TaxID=1402861 RepID=UPI00397ADC66
MGELRKIRTKWHIQGEKEMLKKTVVQLVSIKFKMSKETVIRELGEELKEIDTDKSDELIDILLDKENFNDLKVKIQKLNLK